MGISRACIQAEPRIQPPSPLVQLGAPLSSQEKAGNLATPRQIALAVAPHLAFNGLLPADGGVKRQMV